MINRSANRTTPIMKSTRVPVAKDMRPYSVVKNEGFQHTINALEPRCDLPIRVHFSDNMIPKHYKQVKV